MRQRASVKAARAAVCALAALGVLAAIPAGAAAGTPDPFFRTPCEFSHRAPDDPIVAPGRPGAAHSHDFFGNFSTDAASTFDTLREAGTSCRRAADGAAYWVPTLFAADGTAVTPEQAQIYYRGAGHRELSRIRAFPPGLRVIAGSATATAHQEGIASWHCGAGADATEQDMPQQCPAGRVLRLQVRFPNCWDGANLDSPDHQSHMAYTYAGRCPDSHPVAVPRLVLNVHYPLRDGRGASLSSGHPHTAHADFFNAWDQNELARLVRLCIHGRRGNEPECQPSDYPAPPLDLSADRVTYGDTVTVAGEIGGPAGQAVRVQARGEEGWQTLTELTTGRLGRYEHSFRPEQTARYRVLGPDGRPGRAVTVTVGRRIDTAIRRRGRRVRVRALASPGSSRLVVRAERRVRGRWRLAARDELRTRRGRAVTTLVLRRAGTYRVRVSSRADDRYAAGHAQAGRFRVR